MGAPGKGARLPSRSHLPKNDLEQLSNNPCNKAGDDGQYQGGVSRIRQLVIHLTPEQLHFLHFKFRNRGAIFATKIPDLSSIHTNGKSGRAFRNERYPLCIRKAFSRCARSALPTYSCSPNRPNGRCRVAEVCGSSTGTTAENSRSCPIAKAFDNRAGASGTISDLSGRSRNRVLKRTRRRRK